MMVSSDLEKVCCDVLIIGGGGAGLAAAIKAREMGAHVVIVSKARIGFGNNTFISKASVSAALGRPDPRDNPEVHLKDAWVSGRFLNDRNVLEKIVRGIGSEIGFLKKCGVQFEEANGERVITRAAGHSYPRNFRPPKQVGSEYTLPLTEYARNAGVRFIENIFVTRLFADNGRFSGAVGITEKSNFLILQAKSAVLATGGFAQVYLKTNNAAGMTGDGQALAYDLGLPLKDIEFVQFYPTAVGDLGTRMLLYEGFVLRGGAELRNSAGENIVLKHGLNNPLALTRDRLARAVMEEILTGCDIQGGIILDLSPVPEEKLTPLRHLLPADWSPEQKEFIVSPTTHYCMGGVITNAEGETEISGLFAAGEICAGAHGANRLGGNALAEVFVMGGIAGSNAASFARRTALAKSAEKQFADEQARWKSTISSGTLGARELRRKLKNAMWLKAGIIRDRNSLEEALVQIEEIKTRVNNVRTETPKELIKYLELRNMLAVAEMVCKAALMRTESRGAHYRSDYPEEDNTNWLKNIVIRKENSLMRLKPHSVLPQKDLPWHR